MPWLNNFQQWEPVLWAALACLLIQITAWWYQSRINNADPVDIAWSIGVVAAALIYLFTIPADFKPMIFVFVFPVLWYTRLSSHLIKRFDASHEDGRYQNLRSHWQQHTQLKFLLFFLFQAMLSVMFSLPAFWVLTAGIDSVWLWAMALIWGGLSLAGVSLADHQLLQFKRNNPSSAVCDVGFWRYSRHPNYFFEWLHWWVYPMVLWGTDYFWWSLLVVGLMLVFLLKLTGIPYAEQQALKNRGQAYRDYMNKTNAFFLWRQQDD